MTKMEKEKMIKAELEKLKKLFKDIPKDKLRIVDGLMNQAAFMLTTLTELQELINENGSVELFVNGSQTMNREYPALKSYNATIKNYSSCIKQLIDLLPLEDKKEKEDELLSFIKQK